MGQYAVIRFLTIVPVLIGVPVIVFSFIHLIPRMTGVSLLEFLCQVYLRTAESKGLPQQAVILRHAIQHARLPVMTVTGIQVGRLLAGAILLALSATLLAIAIVGRIGPGLWNSLIAISVVSIPFYARITRGEVLALREREFVTAARGLEGGARSGDRWCKKSPRSLKRRKNP